MTSTCAKGLSVGGVLLALVCLCFFQSAQGQEIVLRPTAQVHTPYVRLADIAELRSWDPALQSAWQDTPLVPSPSPGTIRYLGARQVQELLMLHGFPVDRVPVQGAGRTEISVPRSSVDPHPTKANPGKLYSQEHRVVVAARHLRAGERIRADDVEIKSLSELPRGIRQPLGAIHEVVGLEVTRSIVPGQVLDAVELRRPYLVRRGRQVTITARSGGVVVKMPGRALDDGAQDDLVSVEWLDNRQKRLTARVVGVDTVEVTPQPTITTRTPPGGTSAFDVP